MGHWIAAFLGACLCAAGIAVLRNLDTVAKSFQEARDVILWGNLWQQYSTKTQAVLCGCFLIFFGLMAMYAAFASTAPTVRH